MANNINQIAILAINDSTDDTGLVSNYAIAFNQAGGTVTAHITCTSNFDDKSPLFDYFIQKQPATLKLTIENTINSAGPTTRTIEFRNAMCRDYLETYDMNHQTTENLNDLLVVITIEADEATMGETSFPG
jgi:hypothetical protein